MAYASEDGRYLLRGNVRDTTDRVDLSEASMAQRRLQVLADLGEAQRVSFAPAAPKYRLTVFTDVDCPFCRRLHAQIDQYNALGIAIDYVFFRCPSILARIASRLRSGARRIASTLTLRP